MIVPRLPLALVVGMRISFGVGFARYKHFLCESLFRVVEHDTIEIIGVLMICSLIRLFPHRVQHLPTLSLLLLIPFLKELKEQL